MALAYAESPIQTKPTLARSASRKGQGLKSIDPVSKTGLPNAVSPTLHSPVPLREASHDLCFGAPGPPSLEAKDLFEMQSNITIRHVLITYIYQKFALKDFFFQILAAI